MAAIRGKNNKTTELRMIRFFRSNHIFGWRRHQSDVLGKPDFIFLRRRIAMFIDGCFWHGCKKHWKVPGTNSLFWTKKIRSNIVRDRLITRALRKTGWTVIRVWEHDLERDSVRVITRVLKILTV